MRGCLAMSQEQHSALRGEHEALKATLEDLRRSHSALQQVYTAR